MKYKHKNEVNWNSYCGPVYTKYNGIYGYLIVDFHSDEVWFIYCEDNPQTLVHDNVTNEFDISEI